MYEIEIEKDIPLPPITRNPFDRVPYPWDQMEVGDSFLFPTQRPNHAAAACMAGRRLGRKFATRITEDGIRCWRIK